MGITAEVEEFMLASKVIPIIRANRSVIDRVPAQRVCPANNCQTPLTHTGRGCRHLKCSTCNFKFCFVCLGGCVCCNKNKVFSKKCIHNHERCKNSIAPRQRISNDQAYSVTNQ